MTVPRITQAMIDLYDAYTHVTLDRRGLIAGLGGSAAAAAVLPLLESAAHAAIVPEDDARLIVSKLGWLGADDEPMTGYMARPRTTTAKLPAVIVIHENRGLTPHIMDVTRRMALEGFVAVAPDFLSPAGGTPADEDQARQMIGALDPAKAVANGVSAVDYLSKDFVASSSKVGAIGFCWGGGMVNRLAVAAGKRLKAGVAYYGPAPDPAQVPAIKAAMLLHYGGLDTRINAGIPAYRAALEAAKVKNQIYVYEGANHAFNNDTSPARYDKATADLAWGRTVAWLKDALKPGPLGL
jgi:carboxymethylenebutenolidase